MELNYDWRSFQAMFHPRRTPGVGSTQGPVYVVYDGDIVVSALADGEDMTGWAGASRKELASRLAHREILFFDRKKADEWLEHAVESPHYHSQAEKMRTEVEESFMRKRDRELLRRHYRRHFLIDSLQGKASRTVPANYGLYIRAEGHTDRSILLLIRNGILEGFHDPDLSPLGSERRRQPVEVVKYLSEKYLLPVQGVYVSSAEWAEWSHCKAPWRKVLSALRTRQARLVPFRPHVAALIALRAIFPR